MSSLESSCLSASKAEIKDGISKVEAQVYGECG